jgi:ArsR family metal-binding transcriptional regulator
MIGSYDLEVLTPPCDPASPRLVAKAHLADDIAAVLPYLNAILPDASYWPEAKSLTWKDDEHSIAFHAREIAVADIADGADAARLVGGLVDLVNRTWRRRAEIVPSVATRRRATPMAVYELLPGTNCKDCGLAGCWQFALKLVTGEVGTGDCPSLAQPESASELAALRDLVAESA